MVNFEGLDYVDNLKVVQDVTFSDPFPVSLSICGGGLIANIADHTTAILKWKPEMSLDLHTQMLFSSKIGNVKGKINEVN